MGFVGLGAFSGVGLWLGRMMRDVLASAMGLEMGFEGLDGGIERWGLGMQR